MMTWELIMTQLVKRSSTQQLTLHQNHAQQAARGKRVMMELLGDQDAEATLVTVDTVVLLLFGHPG
jgi:hypothetical protein